MLLCLKTRRLAKAEGEWDFEMFDASEIESRWIDGLVDLLNTLRGSSRGMPTVIPSKYIATIT